MVEDNRTDMSEIYDSFLSKISEYTYLNIPENEIEEDLYRFYKSAKAKFRECRKNLNVTTTTNADGEIERTIHDALDDYEIEIVVNLMLVEWLKPYMLSSNVLKQNLSDKDFKIHSQASQLSQIKETYKYVKAESRKMITTYTYFDLSEERM